MTATRFEVEVVHDWAVGFKWADCFDTEDRAVNCCWNMKLEPGVLAARVVVRTEVCRWEKAND